MTNSCNMKQNDWDVCIPVALWAYMTTCNKLTGQTPCRLVYGKVIVMPMEYIVPILWIAVVTNMDDHDTMEEQLAQLVEMEEDCILVSFHQ